MTAEQIVSSIQAKFSDFTDNMKDRAEAILPLGIQKFCAAHQWEFMDKVVLNLTTSVDATDGLTEIDVPEDIYKPVAFYTNYGEVKYRNRNLFLEAQMAGQPSSVRPTRYTLIGDRYILFNPSDGSAIKIVYTRKSGNFDLASIPDQYHVAIQYACILELTPATLAVGTNSVPNRSWEVAERMYQQQISLAMSLELLNKARDQEVETELAEERAAYS